MFRSAALITLLAVAAAPAHAEKRPVGIMTDKGTLTLYEGQKFQGEYLEVIKELPSISYDFTVGSFAVYPGEKWELCEQTRFRGVCNVFTGNETDLGKIKIQSARPVKPPVVVAPVPAPKTD